jgi:hypothetical protein
LDTIGASFFAKEHDTMIDPAVIAAVAASAANQRRPDSDGEATAGGAALSVALVFGIPSLIMWAICAWT